jgi:hypothetical protein
LLPGFLFDIASQKNELVMENLIWIMIPLVISGLGFLTYRHPMEATKILTGVLIISTLVFITAVFYNQGQAKAFQKSTKAIHSFNIPEVDLMADSSNNSIVLFKNMIAAQAVKDSIRYRIYFLSAQQEEVSGDIFIYFIISILTVAVFYLLAFRFVKLKKSE